MKKVLSVVISILLVCGITVISFAAEQSSTFYAATTLVTAGTKTASYQWARGQSYYLGDAIPTYVLENACLLPWGDADYYPVFQNNDIVGILTEIYSDAITPGYTFSPSFAKKLNSITKSGESRFILVVSGRQVFSVCNGKATELVAYDIPLPAGESDADTSDIEVAANKLVSSRVSEYSVANKRYLPISEVGTYSNDTMFKLLNVNDLIPQPQNSDRCWAATMWCIGEFTSNRAPLFSSYEAFAQSIPIISGVSQDLDQAIVHLANKYKVIMIRRNEVFTGSEIEAEIDKNYPIAMVWKQIDGSYGHMTTGCSYSKGGSDFEVGVMDSLEGDLLWVLQTGNNVFVQQMGNFTYMYCNTGTIVRVED